jgi:lipid A disaccharide synthetase
MSTKKKSATASTVGATNASKPINIPPKSKAKKISSFIFHVIIAILFIASGITAIKALKSKEISLATLETALFGVPQVVCYKGNYLSYLIGKQLIKVPFISLVNLIAGKKVVTELIQRELTTENLQQALSNILNGKEREEMLNSYLQIHDLLGKEKASKKAAELILKELA